MNQYNILIILYFAELILLYGFTFIYIKYNKRESLIFNPLIFFIFGSSFVYIIVPLFMCIFGWSWHHQQYSLESFIKANIYMYIFIWFVIIFYLILFKIFYKYSDSIPDFVNYNFNFAELSKKENFIIIIFFLIPISLDTLYLLKYIFSFDYSYYLANRIILRKGKGLIILTSYMGTLIVPLFFASYLLKIKKYTKIKFFMHIVFFTIFILFPFLVAYVMMGNRLTAFVLLVLIIMVYAIIMNKKFTLKEYIKIFLSGIFLFLFFAFIGFMRANRWNFSTIDIKIFFNAIGNEIEHTLVQNFGNFEHLVWLIQHNNIWDILYGKTFIAGFTNLIPRFVWPDKWLGGGPYLKNIIHPGSYNLNSEKITSYTTGIGIETYMNFGIVGIFIVPFIYAFILILLKKLAYKINGNIVLLLLYLYLTFSVTFLMMFGEFLGVFTRTIVVSFPLIIIYILFSKRSVYK